MRSRTEQHQIPAPVLFPIPPMPAAREIAQLPFAQGDTLLCAGMTREASIELLRLCPGLMASAMLPKLEMRKREGGPDQATVFDWLVAQGYAWRPPGMNTTEVRLTPGGQEKARGVLIYVASGHW
jgi:hypothetical protein